MVDRAFSVVERSNGCLLLVKKLFVMMDGHWRSVFARWFRSRPAVGGVGDGLVQRAGGFISICFMVGISKGLCHRSPMPEFFSNTTRTIFRGLKRSGINLPRPTPRACPLILLSGAVGCFSKVVHGQSVAIFGTLAPAARGNKLWFPDDETGPSFTTTVKDGPALLSVKGIESSLQERRLHL